MSNTVSTSAFTFTEFEQTVIAAYKELREGTDQITIDDFEYLGMDTKKVRGALSSLIQKKAAAVYEDIITIRL